MDIVLLVASLALILVGAELFTNGIEWFGHKLQLAEGAVGSVLAAVATAMPETLIPFIAIVGPLAVGSQAGASGEVGVGAILGAPFMLSTLAMCITGIAVLLVARGGRRTTDLRVNTRVLGRDVGFFAGAYAVAVGSAFLPASVHWLKLVIAAALLVAYAFYVRAHFREEPGESDAAELARLHLTRIRAISRRGTVRTEVAVDAEASVTVTAPRLRIIVAQVLLALVAIILGAQIFVGAVSDLSRVVGLDPRILALVLAPIATELPEKFNSIIWVRSGKDTLAMGNITGAMVFQSCIPTVLGLAFTEWSFGPESALSFASAGAAFLSTAVIFGTMRLTRRLSSWTLLSGGPIYLLYVVAALVVPVPVVTGH